MEFDFNINTLLSEVISVVTVDTPFAVGYARPGKTAVHELEHVINTIGAQSAQAQNLSSPITTWSRMRMNKHRIYILKNPTANNGRGHVIGFIKVGCKQLFVLNHEGTHNEMHPICILDFYIHESQQRRGNGLKIFKFMLQAEDVEPAHLAIDKPSSKFISFLRKHFRLWATIPQVNNFVVFDGFFKNRKEKRRLFRKGCRQQYEDNFQPLSRAFSDDVIKRNRKTYQYNNSLNGIRPVSSSILTGTGDQLRFSRFHNSGQGAVGDMFTRFDGDENFYEPSCPENRRRSLRSRQEEEIITNPYRRVTNRFPRSRQDLIEEKAKLHHLRGDSKPLQELQPATSEITETKDDNFSHNSASSLPDCNEATEHGRKQNFRAQEQNFSMKNASPESGRMHPSPQSHEKFFEAKSGYNSIRNTKYEKPSDMISELKEKDKKTRSGTSMKGSKVTSFGTSWNIFGVPSPSRQRWGHQ